MPSVDQLASALEGLSASSFSDDRERVRARDLLFNALRSVQSPWDVAWDHTWVSPAVSATTRTLIELGAFQKWAEQGAQPITSAQLAELVGADPALVLRLLRVLAGQRLVLQVDADTFAATPWSRKLAEDAFPGIYGHFYSDMVCPTLNFMPDRLRQTGYRNPTSIDDCAFTHWPGSEGKRLFEWAAERPAFTADLNKAMVSHSANNLSQWTDIYPTSSIVAAAKPGRALVVDIGGGQGHDMEKFAKAHPDATPEGSLVLHDLEGILAEVKVGTPAIAVQPHDFFTPEPVRGARAYFIHNVLHDWPDAKAAEILANIRPAMEPGYSRVLIHESLVTELHPPARISISDVHMLACFGAAERSEAQWRRLVADAGLRVVKIWRPEGSAESVIEAEVA